MTSQAARALLERMGADVAPELVALDRRFDQRDGSAWHAYLRGETSLLSYHGQLRAAAWSHRRGVERVVCAQLLSEGLT